MSFWSPSGPSTTCATVSVSKRLQLRDVRASSLIALSSSMLAMRSPFLSPSNMSDTGHVGFLCCTVPAGTVLDGANNVWNRANTRECIDRVPASPPRVSHDIHHRVFWLAARVCSAVCPNFNSSPTFTHHLCLSAWGTSVVRRSPSSATMLSHSHEKTSSSIFSTTSSQIPTPSSLANPQALSPTSTSAISMSMLYTTPPNAQRYSRTKWLTHRHSRSN